MTYTSPESRHAQLETLLLQAQLAYHDQSAPIFTDAEYDAMMAEQRSIEAQNPDLTAAATTQVGTPEPGDVRHATPMQSLDNAFDQAELEAFGARLQRKLAQTSAHAGFTVEFKLDGLSANLEYRDGQLVRATTRGDGESGEDITYQIRQMGVPERIDARGLVEVRGEIYMPHSAFEAYNEAATRRGEAGFKNPRNAAVGSLRKGTSSRLALLKLAIYGVGSLGNLTDLGVDTQARFLQWAAAQGFPTAPGTTSVLGLDEAWSAHQALEAARTSQDFEADGSVVKAQRFDDQQEAGRNSRAPAWAIALKFTNRSTTTTVNDVLFTTGRTGRVTPTADLSPVTLDGSTIARATLHNADYLSALDLHYGDTVTLEKAGGVIPKISGVVAELRPKDAVRVVMPPDCPVCSAPITRAPGQADTYCANPLCPSQSESQLRHVVASDVLDIQHLGEVLIAGLHAAGITEYTQLYDLDLPQLTALRLPTDEGQGTRVLGDKTAAKVLLEIDRSRTAELCRHFRALGMRLTGKGTSTRLAKHFTSLEELAFVASTPGGMDTLQAIDDIGPDTAAAIVVHFTSGPGIAQIQRLADAGVDPALTAAPQTGTGLADMRVVVTGTLSVGRAEAEAWLSAQGAAVSTSITGKTTHLIAGDKAGSKLAKAVKLGTNVLTENQMADLCEKRSLTWLE